MFSVVSLLGSRTSRVRVASAWLALETVGALGLALLAALATAPAQAAPRAASHMSHALQTLHARYVSSDPAANAVVKTAPSVVTVHFAEPVDPSGSAITVYDAKGQVVSQPAQVDASDLKTMRVAMTGDDSEVYLVSWRTVSAADGDPDVGAFNFFVSATGASDLAGTTSTTHTTPTTTPSSASGAPVWLAALIGLLGLIVGAVGGVAWARSRVGASGSAGAR